MVTDRFIEVRTMFGWAITFFIIALVAALFGLSDIAGVAAGIAWILCVLGLILAVVFVVLKREPPV